MTSNVYGNDKYQENASNQDGFIPYSELKITPKPQEAETALSIMNSFFLKSINDFRNQQNAANPVISQSLEASILNKRRTRFQLVHGLPDFDPYNLKQASKIDSAYFNHGVSNSASSNFISRVPYLAAIDQGFRWEVKYEDPEPEFRYFYQLVRKKEQHSPKNDLALVDTKDSAYSEIPKNSEKQKINFDDWTIAPKLFLISPDGSPIKPDKTSGKKPLANAGRQSSSKPEKKWVTGPDPKLNFQIGPHGPLTGLSSDGSIALRIATPKNWYRFEFLTGKDELTHSFSIPTLNRFKVQKIISTEKSIEKNSIAELKIFDSRQSPTLNLHHFPHADKGMVEIIKSAALYSWSFTSTKHKVIAGENDRLSDELGLRFSVRF